MRREAGRLEMYRDAVEAYVEESGLGLTEVAATLVALAVGDDGPRHRSDDDGPRTRREERVDDDGTFLGATFEDGFAPKSSRGPAERGGRRPRVAGMRYRVEVGHKDGVQPGAIVGAITGEGGLRGSDLGKIDIFPSFSLVEISGDLSPETTRRIGAAKVAGRALRIRPDEGPRAERKGHKSTGHGGWGDRPGRGDRGLRPSRPAGGPRRGTGR